MEIEAKDNQTTLMAFMCSVLLHLMLFAAFFKAPSEQTITKVNSINTPLTVFQVKIESPKTPIVEPLPKRQIVSMPANINNTPPKNARFLSDKNTATKVETIKRGDGADAGMKGSSSHIPSPVTKAVPQRQPKQIPATTTTKATNAAALGQVSAIKEETAKKLDLSTDFALLNKLNVAAKERSTKGNESFREPAPFSRGIGTNAKFIGVNGTSDYIPDIKDGDITLLNTKADQYAVFVRRVATAVFYELKDEGWRSLAASDIRAIRGDATVFARLSPNGKLLSATLQKSSGSVSFDSSVLEAVKVAAHDPHPPSAALSSNGTYDFIFMAKAWSRMGMAMRNGFPREERWLLLKTGLE